MRSTWLWEIGGFISGAVLILFGAGALYLVKGVKTVFHSGYGSVLHPVGFRNSVSVRGSSSSTRSAADSVSPGYQGVVNRDHCEARQTNRARFDVDRRI
jgi:hypothetical protein